jgi:hypothetical protein
VSLIALLVILTDGLISIPPGQWRAISVLIPSAGTLVQMEHEVRDGGRVHTLLLPQSEAERFHRGRSVEPICSSGYQSEARLRCRVPAAGPHVLIVDNQITMRRPAMVHLRVDVRAPADVIVRELPPQRRRIVISLSLAVFGAIVVFSARQFLKHSSRS